VNVIYGVAEPVQPPRMGKVRPYLNPGSQERQQVQR
jgi:hypothetical protein